MAEAAPVNPVYAELTPKTLQFLSLGILLIVALAIIWAIHNAVYAINASDYGLCLDKCRLFADMGYMLRCVESCERVIRCP